jgi:nucleoside-diphosphate-sugar epimerase
MRVLVTGGGGFLGSHICRRLHARGDEVVALGRNRYPLLERDGIRTLQADLCDAGATLRSCEGFDAVIHSAAVPAIWGPKEMFRRINVDATRNVLDSCLACGVGKLIYTSTPSVVFGEEELCGVDESQPYPARYLADYPASKAEAEQMVLAANGARLETVALRPHLIFGPGDPHLFPRIILRARAGRLRQVGDGNNLVDVTYIDNAVDAHLLALDRRRSSPSSSGHAYFISQGKPVRLWTWLGDILGRLDLPAVRRAISYRTARVVGAVAERVYRVARIRSEPPMTRFLASQLAKSHYFDISAARRDLGYEPAVSTEEGVNRLVAWLKENNVGGGKAN